jgi:hypothetical protein
VTRLNLLRRVRSEPVVAEADCHSDDATDPAPARCLYPFCDCVPNAPCQRRG